MIVNFIIVFAEICNYFDVFFLDSVTTEIYTLSLHDALPISFTELLFAIGAGDRLVGRTHWCDYPPAALAVPDVGEIGRAHVWNSSHPSISYAVFCLKKKKLN